jgi:hypothetical protein
MSAKWKVLICIGGLCAVVAAWLFGRWQSKREYEENLRAVQAHVRLLEQRLPRGGPDLLERRRTQLAGPNAIDCGEVKRRDDPTKANACAMRANRLGKPFSVRFDLMGADSQSAMALVRLPDHTTQLLDYDSDPSGGGRVGGGVIHHSECLTPVQFIISFGHVTCTVKPHEGPYRFVPAPQ